MGTGYTRNDTSNNIADGNIINAADFDGEYDAIEAAFNSSSGHTHDGTAAEGAPITVLGPSQEFVASSSEVKPSTNAGLDLGTSSLKFKDLYIDGVAYIDGFGGDILAATDKKIQFRDTAIFINSSTDGQLDIDADTTIELNSPEVIATDNFRLKSDAAILTFGADNDVTVTHVADTGLDAKAASGFNLKLQTGDTTVESGNTLGKISFNAPSEASGTDAILVGAEIEAAAEATFSSTVNSTALVFKTNDSAAATERVRIKSDGDVVFTGASANMTWDTSADSLDFQDGGQAAFGSDDDLVITHSGSAGSITNTTGDFTIDAAADIILDADGADVIFKDDGTQIGKITNASNNLEIHSSVSDADIVFKGNDGGVTITALTLDMSEGGKALFAAGAATQFQGATTITTNDNSTQLTLESTDTDANVGPVLELYRNSGSPADSDTLGRITFSAENDADEKLELIRVIGVLSDASDGTEDGTLQYYIMRNGSRISRLEHSSTETVFNQDSANVDFRVESDGEQYALFVDASTDAVHIGGNTDVDDHPLVVHANTNANAIAIRGRSDDIGEITFYENDATTKLGGLQYRNTFTRLDNRASGASLDFATGASLTESASFSGTENVFNDGGVDMDFRVESDTKTHMIAVDAANDAMGIAMVPDTGVRLSVNGQIGPTNGDASAPTYTFYSDPDTGMFRAAANTLGLTAGTVEQFRMSASGGITVNNAQNANVNFIVKAGSSSNAFQVDGSSGQVVINEAGIDIDTRIEGNNNANLFYVDGGNDRVAIGHNVPRAKLDIMGQGTSATNLSMLIGSDEGATVNPSRTNSTDKAMRMGLPHYNTAQSATALMVASSTSGANSIFIGGGTSVMNAATQVHIYAADNTTTATGVSRVQVTGSEMTVNDNSGDFDFRVESDSSTHAFFVEGNDGGGTPSIGFGISDPTKLGTSGTAPLGGGSGAILQLAGDDSQIRMANHVIHSDNGGNTIFHIRNNYGLTNSGAELSLESGHITFQSGTSFDERMRLDPSGNFLFEHTDFTTGWGVNNRAAIAVGANYKFWSSRNSATSRGHMIFYNPNGAVGSITTDGSATLFNTSSDYRLKENVADISDGITRVKQLAPKRFNFIADANKTVDGFLAHEAQTVVPEAVTGAHNGLKVWQDDEELPDGVSVGDNKLDADGNTIPEYQGIDQAKLVPLLTAALKEAIAKIEALETRVTALENA